MSTLLLQCQCGAIAIIFNSMLIPGTMAGRLETQLMYLDSNKGNFLGADTSAHAPIGFSLPELGDLRKCHSCGLWCTADSALIPLLLEIKTSRQASEVK